MTKIRAAIACTLVALCFESLLFSAEVKSFTLEKDSIKHAYVYFAPPFIDTGSMLDSWNVLHQHLFSVPLLFEKAVQEHLPVILVIPDKYATVHPVASNAPWTEGVRVALTWASAFFKFESLGQAEVWIVTYPAHTIPNEEVLTYISDACITQLSYGESIEREDALSKRIIPIDSFNLSVDLEKESDKHIELKAYNVKMPEQHVKLIKPAWQEAVGKRVVITGGAGFIGSHLAEKLLNQGYSVLVLDNFECSVRDNVKALESNPRFQLEKFDITEPFDIEGHVDYVVHLASLPSPAYYYARPLQTLKTGLHGTKNCLELAVKKNARFLFTSTSEVYGDPEISPQPENYPGVVNPIGKRSQYDESKRGAETLIKLYFEKYDIDARIVRIFNTYGPHMMLGDGRVVTNFIRALLLEKPIVIYGDGKQTRSFAYVSDTVDGIFKVLESSTISSISDIASRVFNIGTPAEFTINELAERTNELSLKYFQKPAHIDHIPQFDFDDPKMRKPDITRANIIVGFEPEVLLADGLETTLRYFIEESRSN